MINVTKTFLPPRGEYEDYLVKIWSNGQITNQGPLLKQFEARTKSLLNINDFHFVANGTVALQLALNALGCAEGEIITTPFSYVATTSAILWQNCQPVYVDIDPDTLCIDPRKIEEAITPKTRAILAVHIYGIPCDVAAINRIAKRNKLKVIYDGAHAFAVKYNGKSLLSYGDISTCSFHATKLFHTIEGGAVIPSNETISEKVNLSKRFGHLGDKHYIPGINAKASEFQAAMGLANLKYLNAIIEKRRALSEEYDNLLGTAVRRPKLAENTDYNYSYYPVIFESETKLLNAVKHLNNRKIFPRRYFFPSLNTLDYLRDKQVCPISEDVARKILCLPLYHDLQVEEVKLICESLEI